MKRYGIRGVLPEGDPMRAPHLLGDNWEFTRWYDSRAARDAAYKSYQRQFTFYRRGDKPSLALEKIEDN